MSALKAFGGGKRRPINLFFAEIIIALLFFSISGAVIIKVFATADMKSRQSARLERVIILAQSLAEAYSESGDLNKAAELALGLAVDGSDGEVTLPIENGSIYVTARESREFTGAGELSTLSVTFTTDDKEIYSLDCSAYVRNGGEPDE